MRHQSFKDSEISNYFYGKNITVKLCTSISLRLTCFNLAFSRTCLNATTGFFLYYSDLTLLRILTQMRADVMVAEMSRSEMILRKDIQVDIMHQG